MKWRGGGSSAQGEIDPVDRPPAEVDATDEEPTAALLSRIGVLEGREHALNAELASLRTDLVQLRQLLDNSQPLATRASEAVDPQLVATVDTPDLRVMPTPSFSLETKSYAEASGATESLAAVAHTEAVAPSASAVQQVVTFAAGDSQDPKGPDLAFSPSRQMYELEVTAPPLESSILSSSTGSEESRTSEASADPLYDLLQVELTDDLPGAGVADYRAGTNAEPDPSLALEGVSEERAKHESASAGGSSVVDPPSSAQVLMPRAEPEISRVGLHSARGDIGGADKDSRDVVSGRGASDIDALIQEAVGSQERQQGGHENGRTPVIAEDYDPSAPTEQPDRPTAEPALTADDFFIGPNGPRKGRG